MLYESILVIMRQSAYRGWFQYELCSKTQPEKVICAIGGMAWQIGNGQSEKEKISRILSIFGGPWTPFKVDFLKQS